MYLNPWDWSSVYGLNPYDGGVQKGVLCQSTLQNTQEVREAGLDRFSFFGMLVVEMVHNPSYAQIDPFLTSPANEDLKLIIDFQPQAPREHHKFL